MRITGRASIEVGGGVELKVVSFRVVVRSRVSKGVEGRCDSQQVCAAPLLSHSGSAITAICR